MLFGHHVRASLKKRKRTSTTPPLLRTVKWKTVGTWVENMVQQTAVAAILSLVHISRKRFFGSKVTTPTDLRVQKKNMTRILMGTYCRTTRLTKQNIYQMRHPDRKFQISEIRGNEKASAFLSMGPPNHKLYIESHSPAPCLSEDGSYGMELSNCHMRHGGGVLTWPISRAIQSALNTLCRTVRALFRTTVLAVEEKCRTL